MVGLLIPSRPKMKSPPLQNPSELATVEATSVSQSNFVTKPYALTCYEEQKLNND